MKQVDQNTIMTMAQKLHESAIDLIVNNTIPIYTMKHPSPKSGQPDCPITKMEKEHFRKIMRVKLGAAKTEEERRSIIDHYKSKWSE